MIKDTHGTSTSIPNNSRSNSHGSDLQNVMFPPAGANLNGSFAITLQANNKFKEAVLNEAAKEKDERKMIKKVKQEEERLNKIKLSKVIHYNGNVVDANILSEEEKLDQQLRKVLESRREQEIEKFRCKMKAVTGHKRRKI